MSLLDSIRPRWQHPDASVRVGAVAQLNNAARLRELVASDPSDEVREAAFSRLDDEAELAILAMADNDFSLRALTRLKDPTRVIAVARRAVLPRVRLAAVARIDNPTVLIEIAARDEHRAVRRSARIRHVALGCTWEQLRVAVSQLGIAEGLAENVASYSGTFEDLCTAIVADGRFEVQCIMAHAAQAAASDELPYISEKTAPCLQRPAWQLHDFVELLGGGMAAGAAGDGMPASYRIRIWRQDQDKFRWSVDERVGAMTRNVETWGQSSGR